jgi:RNA polymerase sigma-70 factor (ECF subfamily)
METDESLVTRLRRGEMAAFDTLYGRYEVSLFSFVRSYLRDATEAEDVFHEAFMAVLRDRGEAPRQFRSWVYQTARNLCLNRLRSRQRGGRAALRLVGDEPPDTPEDLLAGRRAKDALDVAVADLNDRLSEVFHLRASGLSYEEMAKVLDVPLGTVKSRTHEMLMQLRKDLAPWTA